MTAQDLKNSILQLAVQGKLVPQIEDDECATILLQKIRNDSKNKVKEPYKKEYKILPTEDDPTFAIPKTWVWVRLGELVSIYGRIGFRGYTTADIVQQGQGAITISPSNIIESGKTQFDRNTYLSWQKYEESPEIKIYNGDLIIVKTGSSYGKCAVIKELSEKATINPQLAVLKQINCNRDYLQIALSSSFCREQFNKFVIGTSIPTFSQEKLANVLIPLPPLAEQARIVEKADEFMPLVEEYDKAEQRLNELNTDFPDKLRKSILQQAVQGKLTERDPSDEPASELLKRIRAEKTKLIAEGKGKADKPYAPISEEELSFDLPKGWTAVRIGELGFYRKGPFGSSLTKQMFVPKGSNSVKVYEQKNAIQKDWTLGEYYISRDYFESHMKGFEVYPGDIIVSCAGTIGESYVMPSECEQGIINQALMRMKIVDAMNLDYFLLYFDYVLKASAQRNSKGAAIKNIPPFDILKNMVMPLPPLAEQKRIIARVDELLAACDELK